MQIELIIREPTRELYDWSANLCIAYFINFFTAILNSLKKSIILSYRFTLQL